MISICFGNMLISAQYPIFLPSSGWGRQYPASLCEFLTKGKTRVEWVSPVSRNSQKYCSNNNTNDYSPMLPPGPNTWIADQVLNIILRGGGWIWEWLSIGHFKNPHINSWCHIEKLRLAMSFKTAANPDKTVQCSINWWGQCRKHEKTWIRILSTT